MPGGGSVRTRVVDGACIFRDRRGRGCLVHAYCLERDLDYHTLKPLVDCLFPLTFSEGVLYPAIEVDDGSLICLDTDLAQPAPQTAPLPAAAIWPAKWKTFIQLLWQGAAYCWFWIGVTR